MESSSQENLLKFQYQSSPEEDLKQSGIVLQVVSKSFEYATNDEEVFEYSLCSSELALNQSCISPMVTSLEEIFKCS